MLGIAKNVRVITESLLFRLTRNFLAPQSGRVVEDFPDDFDKNTLQLIKYFVIFDLCFSQKLPLKLPKTNITGLL